MPNTIKPSRPARDAAIRQSAGGLIGKNQYPVGANITRLRMQRDLTQAALAKRVGVSPTRMCYYENGTNSPTCTVLIQIAKALDVPAAVFFDEAPDKGPLAPVPKTKRVGCPDCGGEGNVRWGRKGGHHFIKLCPRCEGIGLVWVPL